MTIAVSRMGAAAVPPGFIVEPVAEGLDHPTALAFAPDGRVFIAEQRGTVRVVVEGELQSDFFIDLRDEVAGAGFRGLLGIAVDPQFDLNHRVYLAYTVDPAPGEPDESDFAPTFSRVTRYSGSVQSNGNIADPDSREVLLGVQPDQGIPVCRAHTIDALHFGLDGSLFVSAGDGSHYEFADEGGNDPLCFQPPLFEAEQDLGAFRAQSLGSMAGKVLRIDPETGAGLPSNPFWNGDPMSIESRIWVSGLRNPFRFCVKPSASARGPGTLYIGDVGWNTYEEIDVARIGGENFGWPCLEGPLAAPTYPSLEPSASDCSSIMTPSNPGPLTAPLASWHHSNPGLSFPPGYSGINALGGVFYTGTSYPMAYRGAYFYAEPGWGWVNVLRVDDSDRCVNSFGFATDISWAVDLEADPASGDLLFVTVFDGRLWRISYQGPGVGDINGDGMVGIDDLLSILNGWGACGGGPSACPADIDGNGDTAIDDLLLVILNWT